MFAGCVAKESAPNPDIWSSYTNRAVGFEIKYQLPGGARELVSPQNITDLSGVPGVSTIFNVGYDFVAASYVAPRFQVSMRVQGFVSELETVSVEDFSSALVTHERYVTQGTLGFSEPMVDQWKFFRRDNLYYAMHEGKDFLSYTILLNDKYFLRVIGVFGRYARNDDEWVANRRSLFKKIVDSIIIRRE